MENYEVPLEDGMVVLYAVLHVHSHLAKDLAVRWNCKAAKCVHDVEDMAEMVRQLAVSEMRRADAVGSH